MTDQNSEYYVLFRRYFFDEFMILEYKIKNTQEGIHLKNVSVNVSFRSEDLKVAHQLEAEQIQSG